MEFTKGKAWMVKKPQYYGVSQQGCCKWLDGRECGQCSKRVMPIDRRNLTRVVARHRRSLTWAKWEEGKKVSD